jgi:NAD-dependent SIR2 family protein deacetylase
MSTWLYPPAFAETFRCEHCACDFDEDDMTEYARNYWTCKPCAALLKADAEKWGEDFVRVEAAE